MIIFLEIVNLVLKLALALVAIYFLVWSFRQSFFRCLPWIMAYIVVAFACRMLGSFLDWGKLIKSLCHIMFSSIPASATFGETALIFSRVVSILLSFKYLLIAAMVAADAAHIYVTCGNGPKTRLFLAFANLRDRISIMGSILIGLALGKLVVLIWLVSAGYAK